MQNSSFGEISPRNKLGPELSEEEIEVKKLFSDYIF
jgi:hypothetical protein